MQRLPVLCSRPAGGCLQHVLAHTGSLAPWVSYIGIPRAGSRDSSLCERPQPQQHPGKHLPTRTPRLANAPQTLLESGAKVNSPDVDGWLPLHVAAYYGAAEITGLLLNHNALVRDRRRRRCAACSCPYARMRLLAIAHPRDS